MENHNGLVVGAEASHSATRAECKIALELLDRVTNSSCNQASSVWLS